MKENGDGLFNLPVTEADWIVMSLSILGYLFRMYLLYSTPVVNNPKLRDWLGIGVLNVIYTITVYEYAIGNKWNMRNLYIFFAVGVVLIKEVTDWLFLSADGKNYIILTVKSVVEKILSNFGYTKDNNNKKT